MAPLSRRAPRIRLRAAVILGAAITAPVILMGGSAQAALSGTGWSAAVLPPSFDLVNAAPLSPASCVRGTRFCVVVAGNDAVVGVNGLIGQGDLVTTDGGAHWTGFTDLPSASMTVTAISCPSTKICWVSGPGPSDQPEVANSADGGKTWTLATPADWANAAYSWWPNSIDCVSTTTCWLAGQTANSTQNPEVAETTNGGGPGPLSLTCPPPRRTRMGIPTLSTGSPVPRPGHAWRLAASMAGLGPRLSYRPPTAALPGRCRAPQRWPMFRNSSRCHVCRGQLH
jgi:hypothetical protein